MINLNKTVRYFCAALVLSSALASCGTNAVSQPPTQTVVVTKSQAVQTLERIAAQKGFVGATTVSDVTDGTSSYKVATIERTQGGNVETLVAVEQASGEFQVVSINMPSNVDQVNVNTASLMTVSTLDNTGKVTDTKKLSEMGAGSEVSASAIPYWIWQIVARVVWRILSAYGRNISCDFLNNKVRQWTGFYYSTNWNWAVCAAVGL